LEAIGRRDSPAQDFREVVVNALDPHLREEERRSRDLNVETANVVGRGVDDLVDQMTADMTAMLKQYAINRLEDHESITSLRYDEDKDSVFAAVDLDDREDSEDNRIPAPLPWDDYLDGAIDPETTGTGRIVAPRPTREGQVSTLQDVLLDEMTDEDGDIGVEDILDFDV
jgi:hypothetical protein